ncbi:MAG: translocation/assembly module TamB domain-containing protein [Pseudomonadota bacterium]
MAGPELNPSSPPAPDKDVATYRKWVPKRRWRWRWTSGFGILVEAIVLFLLIAIGGLWWWSGTEGSLATALRWAARSQPLVAEQVSGSLRKGGRVLRLQWQNAGLALEGREVELAWQPLSALTGHLKLERFAAASLRIDDRRPAGTPSTGPPASIELPLALVLEDFSVGKIEWVGPPAVEVSGLRGRYEFTGTEHRLALANADVLTGRYQGKLSLSARAPLTLDASLSGIVDAPVPGSQVRLPLAITASARGPLTELSVEAALALQQGASPVPPGDAPVARANARVLPWAVQRLPEAKAEFANLDVGALWSAAPRTRLTGTANVTPGAAPQAWSVTTTLRNALPGPWDKQRLPVERMDAVAEWRDGKVLVRSLDAAVGGGQVQASGEWLGNGAATGAAASDWKVKATLQRVRLSEMHSQLAPQTVGGRADLNGRGERIEFDAALRAAAVPARTLRRSKDPVIQLQVRDLTAQGQWNSADAGGTLDLKALQLRTVDAELKASGRFQPKAQGGTGRLALAAPGLKLDAQGELRPERGTGELVLQATDAAQLMRWVRSLPAVAQRVPSGMASGKAEARVSWKGGWRDPALNAQLDAPSLDWQADSAPGAPAPEPIKVRALQARINGRLSQADVQLQGRVDTAARRITLKLQGDAGAEGRGARPWSVTAWRATLRQLALGIEDPLAGKGTWQVQTRSNVELRGNANAFEAGAGQAVLIAPTGQGSTMSSQATLAWQPVRWKPGEVITAGTLKGLPLAWIELFAGPQLGASGVTGNLVFDGQWNAVINATPRIRAELARSSGDLTVQAETGSGGPARVSAGIRAARLALEASGESIQATVHWDSERAGTVDGDVQSRLQRVAPDSAQGIGGWAWAPDAPLSGQLKAQLPRIGAWSVLAPPGWRLRGSLGTELTLGGTRAEPQLTGDLRANDLALRSVVDGIEFGNGKLRARLEGTRMRIDEFVLQGAGGATGGIITAQGEAGWIDKQPRVQLKARLERLRASIRTDRELTVSGDLQASLNGLAAEITGLLRIDQARILLPAEGRPELGSDVVVRSGTRAGTGEKGPAQARGPIDPVKTQTKPLKIAVQLDLGNDFRVQGKGIDTRVRGALSLTGDSLAAPRLTGSVTTSGGEYRAYGQRLDVERGLLRFTGPIDNPVLDILAIRPNMTQRVGVQITGTALLPRVRLYAEPELPDAEKLSWLVLGRSSASGGAEAALLQQAALSLLGSKGAGSGGLAAAFGLDELSFKGGDGGLSGGAITLGKRFSRNFYAAYERSLSSALGTLYVFYELSQRFTVRAQTGEQTAIDLIFTVPYD